MSKIIREDLTSYSIIGNEALRDKTLSARAKGVFAYMMTLPNDWTLYKTELYTNFTEGRDAINKALEELQTAGYLVMQQSREGGKFAGQDFVLYNSPVTEKPLTVKPVPENPQLLINDYKLNTDINKKNIIKKPKEEDFSLFWEAYPRKVNKKKAYSAFMNCKTLPDIKTHIDILNKRKVSEDWKKENGKFIPHPTTWINGERWEDTLSLGKFTIRDLPEKDKIYFTEYWMKYGVNPKSADEVYRLKAIMEEE